MFAKNQSLVHLTNQLLILGALRKKSLARIELAETLHMSGPSVSKHVDQLLEKGLVLESGVRSSGLGRRRVLLKFNPRRGYVCAVELCAHTARLSLADLDGVLLEQAELEPYAELDSLVLARVVKQIGKLLGGQSAASDILLGACLMNGHVPCRPSGEPEPMMQALIELESLIRAKYGCPVFLEHSTRMAALGESLHRERPEGTLFYVYVGGTVSAGLSGGNAPDCTSPDSAFFGSLDELIPDAVSAVAEWRSGGVSNRNTLGEQVCLPAVVRAVAEKFVRGEGYLGEQFEEPEALTPEDIRAGAEKGDSVCLFAIQNAALRLSVSLANLVRFLDVDEIVIGGPIDRLGPGYFDTVSQFLISTLSLPHPLIVRRSALENDAMLCGGALRATEGALAALVSSPSTST